MLLLVRHAIAGIWIGGDFVKLGGRVHQGLPGLGVGCFHYDCYEHWVAGVVAVMLMQG